MNDFILYKNNNEYEFVYNDDEYIFTLVYRNEVELMAVNEVINGSNIYDQIISNINNQLVTQIYNRYYILIKKSKYKKNLEELIFNNSEQIFSYNYLESINHSNWVKLWSKKIDYIEYQLEHFENKYPNIEKSINYYIGMVENAIFYISHINNLNDINNNLVISHIRVLGNNINNPQNIIIDHKSRDISEYLKFIFINDNYNYENIKVLLQSLNLDPISCKLIYGRLFYPTFYFDIYNQIINGVIEEGEIVKITDRVLEYEDYIINIYDILNQIQKIPRITWL